MSRKRTYVPAVEKDGSTTSSNTEYGNGAFIDHRKHNDLAHIHSSPARTRRRNSQLNTFGMGSSNADETLPLTNRNLKTFNSTESVSPTSVRTPRLPDMDSYAREQTKYVEEPLFEGHGATDDHEGPGRGSFDNRSINSLEFGESNPSSEHSSDSTSLDDVCFPDYYVEGQETQSRWPDLNILREFIDQEAEELDGHANNHVNFAFENEMDSVSKNSLQVTPTPIQPWDKPTREVTQTVPILNRKRLSEDVCRFTYFRDDLANTIHAPTLSGLLIKDNHTKVKEQPKNLNQKWRDKVEGDDVDEDRNLELEDLFQPIQYSNLESSYTSKKPSQINLQDLPSGAPSGVPSGVASPLLGAGPISIETPLKQVLRAQNTGIDNLSQTPGTLTESVGPSISPFWLDVLDPTEEEMKVLSKTFGIHPLTTEDIFLGEAREKVELFKSYYFICFTSFDIVYERRKQRIKEHEKKLIKLQELSEMQNDNNFLSKVLKRLSSKQKENDIEQMSYRKSRSSTTSRKSMKKKIREGELSPLSMYMIVFKHGVITFHFSATPHPINVRRRARLLKDYLTVSSDWISYALIDDITDSFAPMIDSIEQEVNSIEEAILRMHAGDNDTDDESEDSDDENESKDAIFVKRGRSKSTVDKNGYKLLEGGIGKMKTKSRTSTTSSSSSTSKILGWKRKGDMLRRIGECRKRVMSLLRLLGSKADVIKGFSKRLNETDTNRSSQSKSEITMYLGDIQDHIVTMVQSLNHYEKLLARFHSNYLAQINIDMTKVNNDTNDVLGKITILGTIVLPINVVTGLWGMNCIVPGQEYPGLAWFWGIIGGMIMFSIFAYNYAKRVYGL